MPSDQYEFGAYRLDAGSRTLFRAGDRVALAPKAADLLLALVEAEGTVLSRQHLVQRLWPNIVVEDGSLTSHISLLRKVLGHDAAPDAFIETVAKRGYRFAAAVRRRADPEDAVSVDRAMLVVLPFENLSGGERYDYFSDGLTEEMITELARLSPDRLGVIARTSAMHFKATTKTIAQIGTELGVSHVLEGSVRQAGARLRITVQLIRVSDESHLWAQNYERGLQDVLELQAEVASIVAREILIHLSPSEQRRLDDNKARSTNPQAYELYLRGRHHWYRRTEEGIRRSIDCFDEALHFDPGFAAAYDGISDAHTMLACRGMTSPYESFHKAKTAARQAVRLQPELGEGYASLAHVRLHDWDWLGLEDDFRQAVTLDPGYAIAHYWYAEFLMAMGRTEDAVSRVEHARTLDPINSSINASLGMIRYLAHDYDGALAALRRGLDIDPTHYVSHLRVGLVKLQKNAIDEAIDAMHQAVLHSGGSNEALVGLAQAQAVSGDKHAMETMESALDRRGGRYVSPYHVARAYGAINDEERALQWLERAYQEHNPDLIEMTREPAFSGLRANSGFLDIVKRVGWPT